MKRMKKQLHFINSVPMLFRVLGYMSLLSAEMKVKANMKSYRQHYNTGAEFEQLLRGLESRARNRMYRRPKGRILERDGPTRRADQR
jgi:predicted unusual protein kinase regulating ubiquinone biosynthesis (AarF/ABC1/UbiB family)